MKVFFDDITGIFPNITLLDGFGIFDSISLPQDLSIHATHGFDLTMVPTTL